ncbi:MAG: HAD family hydrolase [Deltaproteobacteria bacterium]|nr:HAD family hydrolase [Deltaproteobacteria bacterium]
MNNPPKKIRGILFDFDGTLTFPGALDFPAIKRAIGCPPDIPILEYLDTLSPRERAPLEEILDEKEETAATGSLPNRGAEVCLSALKERGFLLGILTRNSLKSVHIALKHFTDIGQEDFDVIITRFDSPPKPHPDGVYQAALRMGLSPEEILVVGDFRFDVIAGKAAGSTTVLLSPQGKSIMQPGDPEPDFIVGHLEEILDIVGGRQDGLSVKRNPPTSL